MGQRQSAYQAGRSGPGGRTTVVGAVEARVIRSQRSEGCAGWLTVELSWLVVSPPNRPVSPEPGLSPPEPPVSPPEPELSPPEPPVSPEPGMSPGQPTAVLAKIETETEVDGHISGHASVGRVAIGRAVVLPEIEIDGQGGRRVDIGSQVDAGHVGRRVERRCHIGIDESAVGRAAVLPEIEVGSQGGRDIEVGGDLQIKQAAIGRAVALPEAEIDGQAGRRVEVRCDVETPRRRGRPYRPRRPSGNIEVGGNV